MINNTINHTNIYIYLFLLKFMYLLGGFSIRNVKIIPITKHTYKIYKPPIKTYNDKPSIINKNIHIKCIFVMLVFIFIKNT